MPDCVDAAVKEAQPPRPDRAMDCTRSNPPLEQLLTCYDAMLRLREEPNRFISPVRSCFTPHTGVKCDLARALPRGRLGKAL